MFYVAKRRTARHSKLKAPRAVNVKNVALQLDFLVRRYNSRNDTRKLYYLYSYRSKGFASWHRNDIAARWLGVVFTARRTVVERIYSESNFYWCIKKLDVWPIYVVVVAQMPNIIKYIIRIYVGTYVFVVIYRSWGLFFFFVQARLIRVESAISTRFFELLYEVASQLTKSNW